MSTAAVANTAITYSVSDSIDSVSDSIDSVSELESNLKISKKIVLFILGVFLLIAAVILFSLCVFSVVNSLTTQILIGTGLGMIVLGFSLFIIAAMSIFRSLGRAREQTVDILKSIESNNVQLIEKLVNEHNNSIKFGDLQTTIKKLASGRILSDKEILPDDSKKFICSPDQLSVFQPLYDKHSLINNGWSLVHDQYESLVGDLSQSRRRKIGLERATKDSSHEFIYGLF